MERLVIKGGKELRGKVEASGSKNAGLAILASSILLREPFRLKMIPYVADILTMIELLDTIGVKCLWEDTNTLYVDPTSVDGYKAPYELVKKMRASIYVLGPLIVRKEKGEVSLPGGCAFGPRPIDMHLMGLRELGVELQLEEGYIKGKAHLLSGNEIVFDKKSVGATIHIMTTSVLARGKTVIVNAAQEPEVQAVAMFLNACGASIKGAGEDTIEIEGVESLHSPVEFVNIPDRIEVGTLLIAGEITGGRVTIENCMPDHLRVVIDKLKASGAKLEEGENSITLSSGEKIYPLNIHTSPFPGFPTDMQPLFVPLLSLAEGTSIIQEGVYPDRFIHCFELIRLGADIKIEGNTAFIQGPSELRGAPLMASDIRACASLVVAGLKAEGITEIDRIYHLDRGYEKLEEKLRKLGGEVERIKI